MSTSASTIVVGCAGWSIPKQYIDKFPTDGTHLERYSRGLDGVEINSSFYRPHRHQTYIKWAASVPDTFRFAVKVPKSITHEQRLKDATEPLERFLEEVSGLGHKLGPLLVQLPPSLVFNRVISESFFSAFRARFDGSLVCEPRHASWFGPDANDLLVAFEVARVVADPPPVPQAAVRGGWPGMAYYRLHGSPTIYRSAYSSAYLDSVLRTFQRNLAEGVPTWCIFDNTAEGAATGNALEVVERLRTGKK
jgi:uncharacterized protein YecE (DUF72 family)